MTGPTCMAGAKEERKAPACQKKGSGEAPSPQSLPEALTRGERGLHGCNETIHLLLGA